MTRVLLRSLAFDIGFYGGSAALALALPPALALPRGALVAAGRAWARWTNFLLRAVVGAEIVIENADRLPAGGCVVAAKHRSTWEAAALLGLLPDAAPDAAYVLKRELLRIPVFGWYVRKNLRIVVDRGGAAALYAALGVPVVPIAPNSGAVWGRGAFVKRPGRIVLRVLEPIPPGLSRAAFTAVLEERIETASAALAGD